jgi:hypothetical protein
VSQYQQAWNFSKNDIRHIRTSIKMLQLNSFLKVMFFSTACFFLQTSNAQTRQKGAITDCNRNQPRLILLNSIYTEAMTSNIVKNISYIDTLPFDGIVLNGGDMWNTFGNGFSEAAFRNTEIPYSEILAQLQPLSGKFKNLKHFFIQINVVKTADFFDDWSVIINNWRMTARALKEAGPEFAGIFFDNEEYTASRLWHYPDNVDYKSKSLAEYIAQARMRGRQIMEACLEEFPEIKIITAHGPYWSEPKAPLYVSTQTGYIELAGPFFVGMAEAQTEQSLVLDGGENYRFRNVMQFEASYQWRKYTIASVENDSPDIQDTLRPVWPDKISISFGVSDVGNNPSYGPMDPSIMRTTLENALNRCDDYVWYYPESDSRYILRPGAYTSNKEWIDAISGAYNASKAFRSDAPDMIVTNINISPQAPDAGQPVIFSATIKNQGCTPTPPGVINSVLFTVDSTSWTLSDTSTKSIQVGDSLTVTASGGPTGASWTATAGHHIVDAWVNNSGKYPERQTANNHLRKSFTVEGDTTDSGNEKVITIWPNPFNTSFSLKLSKKIIVGKAVMDIYDLNGSKVRSLAIKVNETVIDRGKLKSNIYFFNIINNSEKIGSGKLIVQ